ncbi:MAG TPA: hypothetical protein VGM88_12200 [Kofleriaceae bacterium]
MTWMVGMLVLSASVDAFAQRRPTTSPDGRLNQIEHRALAVLHAVRDVDAGSAAALADQLEHAAAELSAALPPDLDSSPTRYRSVAAEIAKLKPAAAAVRLFPPCVASLRKVIDDHASNATTAEQLTTEIGAARAACAALDAAVAAGSLDLGTLRDKAYATRQEVTAIGQQVERDRRELAVRQENARAAAAIAATTVMGRLPEFTLDDSYRPEKVAEAFEKMPSELLVAEPARERFGTAHVERFPHEPAHAWCESGDGKAVSSVWYHNGQASAVKMLAPAARGAGGPMLVWQRDTLRTVFVTMDGIRYEALNSALPYDLLVKGLPARETWPTTPQDICIDGEGLGFVVDHQLASAGAIAKYKTADDALSRCIQKTWSSGDGAFAANATANVTASTRDNRYDALLDSYKSKVERACDGQRRAWQAAVEALSRDAAQPRVELVTATTKALDAARTAASPNSQP